MVTNRATHHICGNYIALNNLNLSFIKDISKEKETADKLFECV